MTDGRQPVPPPEQLAELIAATTDEPLVEGDQPVSVWMLVKSRDAEGDTVWGVRNAGEPFTSEELQGAPGSPGMTASAAAVSVAAASASSSRTTLRNTSPRSIFPNASSMPPRRIVPP